MGTMLTFTVQGGPMIGHSQALDAAETTLGGKGSAADVELSGLPHGAKFIELRQDDGGTWRVEEMMAGAVLLNGRRLKRRNSLRDGDTITLPSITGGEGVNLKIGLEKIKGQGGLKLPALNPTYVAAVVVYGAVLIGAGVLLSGTSNGPTVPAERPDVSALIEQDIKEADMRQINLGPGSALLTTEPRTFEDLQIILASRIPAEEKAIHGDAFTLSIERRFARARQLASLGRSDEAQAEYELIVSLLRGAPRSRDNNSPPDAPSETTLGQALLEMQAVLDAQ